MVTIGGGRRLNIECINLVEVSFDPFVAYYCNFNCTKEYLYPGSISFEYGIVVLRFGLSVEYYWIH